MLTTIRANVSDRVCTTGTHLSCGVLGVLEVRVVAVIDISGGGGLSTSTLGAVGVIRWLVVGLYSSGTYPLGGTNDVSVAWGFVPVCHHCGGQ